MIKLDKYPLFSEKDTLKNLSENNGAYMIESDIEAIHFDEVKTLYAKKYKLKKRPTSNDALFQVGDKIYFVEFKNGNVKHELNDIERKIYDSLFLFCDITDQHISDTRQYMTYILVYNLEKSEQYIRSEHGEELLQTNEIQDSDSYIEIAKQVAKYSSRKNFDLFGLRKRVLPECYFFEFLLFNRDEFSSFLDELEITDIGE